MEKGMNGRHRQYLWVTGEVGDRLTAIRDTDAYQQSAHTIRNLLVTELGNLKMAKAYTTSALADLTGEVITAINTPWDLYVVVTTKETATFRYDGTKLASLLHSADLPMGVNISLVDVFLFICEGSTTILEINPDDGQMGVSNFKDSMELPLQNRGFVGVDLYQVRTIDSKTKPYLVRSEDELELEKKSDGTYVKGTSYKISRFYFPYQADLITMDISGLSAGQWIVSVHPFTEVTNGSFYCGNKKFSFTGKTSDTSGEWYNNTNLSTGDTGVFDYGILRDIKDDILDVVEHQDRLVIMHDKDVYFSKIGDYNNFRNGTQTADAFYFRPSHIRGEQPSLLKMVAGRGLFMITNRGIYLCGYNEQITPTNIDNKLVSDEPCLNECVIVDDLLYFLTKNYDIMGIENISQLRGVVDFKAFYVDKYSTQKTTRYLRFVRVGGENYCMGLDGVNPVGKLYKNVGINQYSMTSMDIPHPILTGLDDDLISINGYHDQSDNNMLRGYLKMNPPLLQTGKGGYYLNDIATKFYRVVMRVLDEDNQAVDYVKIGGYTLNRLGQHSGGIYSVYKTEDGKSIVDGVDIEIFSQENDKTLEIQATEIFYSVGAD